MSPINSLSTSYRSRLTCVVTDLSQEKVSTGDHNLAERLGHLTGLSGSMTLAKALQKSPTLSNTSTSTNPNALQKEMLDERERMMNVIAKNFRLDESPARMGVPTAFISSRIDALTTFEPYRRFYTSQQIELAVGVPRLRARLRKGLLTISVELGQLAALDKALEESLNASNRTLFNVTVKVLERRFAQRLADQTKENPSLSTQDALAPGGWLNLFYQDVLELLLAELDERLQPVFGLLEALNEHMKTT